MLDLSNLQEAVRHEGGVSRRLFLAYSASLSAVPLLGPAGRRRKRTKPKFATDPFSLGVASGDPTANGVVLWTRLAPQPLEPSGGMEPHNVEVNWEIAEDEAMRHVVRRGTAVAHPKLAHSVHVEADNLEPDRWYWYRFRSGDAESPIGRTRTMPAERFHAGRTANCAFASCQHYEAGLYTAYEHMAKEELDLVFHLGDYIYEQCRQKTVRSASTSAGDLRNTRTTIAVRHSQYKTDPLLQAMHGAARGS